MTRKDVWTEAERETPVILETDVVVVGGSPTGVAAAVGAARAGASAVILERDGMLGGQAADIYTISPWQFIDENLDWVVGGVTREIFLRTAELGDCDYLWETVPGQIPPAAGDEKPFEIVGNGLGAYHKDEGFLHWRDAMVEPQSLRSAMHHMCEEAGVTLLLDSTMAGVMMEGSRVIGVLFEFRGQRFGVGAKVVVDATGHGDVAARAGGSFENYHDLEVGYWRLGRDKSLKPSRAGYAGTHSRICNVDFDETLAYMRERPDQWRLSGGVSVTVDQVARMAELRNAFIFYGFQELRWKAIQDNPEFESLAWRDSATPDGLLAFTHQGDGLVFQWVSSRRPVDLLDPIGFSELQADIRKQHWLAHRLYRDYVPGFQNSRFLGIAPHVGTAFGRRVAVEHAVTTEEMTEGAHFDDVVGRVIGHDWSIVAQHRGFEVPYRSLLPQGVDGLLVTGKSSGDFIHCVATCACTGHAAGVAAGLAAIADQTPRELDVGLLQKTLLEQDTVL